MLYATSASGLCMISLTFHALLSAQLEVKWFALLSLQGRVCLSRHVSDVAMFSKVRESKPSVVLLTTQMTNKGATTSVCSPYPNCDVITVS